jgi:hypothetical protein
MVSGCTDRSLVQIGGRGIGDRRGGADIGRADRSSGGDVGGEALAHLEYRATGRLRGTAGDFGVEPQEERRECRHLRLPSAEPLAMKPREAPVRMTVRFLIA